MWQLARQWNYLSALNWVVVAPLDNDNVVNVTAIDVLSFCMGFLLIEDLCRSEQVVECPADDVDAGGQQEHAVPRIG